MRSVVVRSEVEQKFEKAYFEAWYTVFATVFVVLRVIGSFFVLYRGKSTILRNHE